MNVLQVFFFTLAVLFLPATAQAARPVCPEDFYAIDCRSATAQPNQGMTSVFLPSIFQAPSEQVADAQIPATGEEASTYHIVQRGESLAKIARRYEAPLDALVMANPQVVNPARIFIGDRLRIPAPEEFERLQAEAAQRQQAFQQQIAASVPHRGERWMDVDLASQTARAYEGDTLVRSFVVSTGTARYPTITGQFRVWTKLRYDDMRGPGYYLEDVPHVMYFHKGYGLHGTYWHNNFGTPMSHGCVNLRAEDAAWLFDFGYVGMLVNVH